MNGRRNVLLIVGSPRQRKSTSASLGNYLLSGLARKGFQAETVFAVEARRSLEALNQVIATAEIADIVVLAFPLYADSLPSPLIEVMESLAAYRMGHRPERRPRLVAIANSGFPEAAQSAVALRICRRFAREAAFFWAGGLALGGGEAIGGKPLASAGGAARRARRALDLAAAALSEGGEITEEAAAVMARPFVPRWLYTMMGNFGWKRDAKREGSAKRLTARPYPQ